MFARIVEKIENYNRKRKVSLIDAILESELDVVKKLIRKKADVNQASSFRSKPLFLAVESREILITKELLDAKADVNFLQEGIFPSTALICAVELGVGEIIDALLEAKAHVNLEANGRTALIAAVEGSKSKTIKKIIDAKADVNISNHIGTTPLLIAVRRKYFNISKNRIAILEALIAKKAKLNDLYSTGESLLHVAIDNEAIPVIEFLLKAKADIDLRRLHYYDDRHSCQGESAFEYSRTKSDEIQNIFNKAQITQQYQAEMQTLLLGLYKNPELKSLEEPQRIRNSESSLKVFAEHVLYDKNVVKEIAGFLKPKM